jgi:hypothetical protein
MLHLLLQHLKSQAVSLTYAVAAHGGVPLTVTGTLWDIFDLEGKPVALLLETMRETKPNLVPLHPHQGGVGRPASEFIQNFYMNFIDVEKILSVRVIAGFHIDEKNRKLESWPKMEIYKDSDDVESTQAWREGITRKIEKQLQVWGMRPYASSTVETIVETTPIIEI